MQNTQWPAATSATPSSFSAERCPLNAVRRCALILALAASPLLGSCGGGGGGDGGLSSLVPNTPLTWNEGTWDQVRWN